MAALNVSVEAAKQPTVWRKLGVGVLGLYAALQLSYTSADLANGDVELPYVLFASVLLAGGIAALLIRGPRLEALRRTGYAKGYFSLWLLYLAVLIVSASVAREPQGNQRLIPPLRAAFELAQVAWAAFCFERLTAWARLGFLWGAVRIYGLFLGFSAVLVGINTSNSFFREAWAASPVYRVLIYFLSAGFLVAETIWAIYCVRRIGVSKDPGVGADKHGPVPSPVTRAADATQQTAQQREKEIAGTTLALSAAIGSGASSSAIEAAKHDSDVARFCGRCGKPRASEADNFCRSCGSPI